MNLSSTAVSDRRGRTIVDKFPSELVAGRYRISNLHQPMEWGSYHSNLPDPKEYSASSVQCIVPDTVGLNKVHTTLLPSGLSCVESPALTASFSPTGGRSTFVNLLEGHHHPCPSDRRPYAGCRYFQTLTG